MFHILSLPRESSKRKSSKHAGQFPQASLPSQPPEHAEQLPQASLPGPSSEHVFQACLHRYQHHIISQAVSGQARMLHKVQKYRDAGMPRLDRPRIVNRKLNPKECSQLRTQCANPVECSQLRTQCARLAAKDALCFWYQAGYRQVCLKLRETQIDENLELAKKHLHFKDAKRLKDGFIMLKSMFGDPEPVVIRLLYDEAPTGGLTYRQLHTQLREHLSLLPVHHLRICPHRPWYQWMTQGCCVPEHRALPNNDRQCRDILGTTLVFYSYGDDYTGLIQ